MDNFHVYKDIEARTGGDIYIGVVGPVRTGKSTFIKRFMELLVIPKMEDENQRNLSRDELPQSAAGKTIMTTEPKFIPKEAAKLSLGDGIEARVRLIDCVGYPASNNICLISSLTFCYIFDYFLFISWYSYYHCY